MATKRTVEYCLVKETDMTDCIWTTPKRVYADKEYADKVCRRINNFMRPGDAYVVEKITRIVTT